MTNSSELMIALRERFPEIVEDLDDDCWKGLLHLEVAVLSRVAQAAITEGNKESVRRCFDFADWAFRTGDEKVKNAICVSFLEHLTFVDTKKRQRSWAYSMLSKTLQQEFKDLMAYLDQIHGTDDRRYQVPYE